MQERGGRATANEERDINDAFNDIFLTENHIFEESFKEGYEQGKKEENLEAFHLGYHRGAEIGAEIGFYTSVVNNYLTYFEENKTAGDCHKLLKELALLKQILINFPEENDSMIDFSALVSQIRARFKKISAALKIHPAFSKSDKLSF